tara:strand:+ start:295 stop:618 length:324 start_codon:yes stop_codon:yes gene_type:complete
MKNVKKVTFQFLKIKDWEKIKEVVSSVDINHKTSVVISQRSFNDSLKQTTCVASYDCGCEMVKLGNVFDLAYREFGITRMLVEIEEIKTIEKDVLEELKDIKEVIDA